MRNLAFVLAAFVVGCGSGSMTVSTSSTPPSGGGADGGVGTPMPGGGSGGMPGGGGAGGAGGGSGGGGAGGVGGGGGGAGGGSGGGMACPTSPTVIGANFEPRASDGAYVYGFSTQQIARIAVGGGAQQTVVSGIDTSVDFALLVAGSYVYWTVEPDGVHPTPRMFRAAKAGGDQPTFLSGSGNYIVADDAFVYTVVDWMGNGNGLVSVTESDGRVSDEQIGGGGSTAGVDDQYVYYEAPGPNYPANVSLWRVSKVVAGGAMPEKMATWQVYGDSGPTRSVSDGKSAFFWDFGRVVRVDFATGSVTLLYDPQRDVTVPSGDRAGQMAVDDTSVYWTASNDYVEPRYVLDAVDKDGNGLRTLHSSNIVGGHGVVVVGDSVYFNEGTTLYQQCKR